MSGRGRETLLDVQECSEALPNVCEWLGDPSKCLGVPPECPGTVVRPSRMSACDREPSQMSGSGREALPDVRERSKALADVQD